MPHPALSPHALSRPDVLRVAVEADTDPRTVVRFLQGEPIRPRQEVRIRRALAALGLSA